MSASAYVLQHSNGTYFRKWVNGFGPMFGATLAETKRFETRADAASWLADWRMSGVKVVKVAADRAIDIIAPTP